MKKLLVLVIASCSITACAQLKPIDAIKWGQTALISHVPVVNNFVKMADGNSGESLLRDNYGAQYGRMLQLKDGNWLASYTVSQKPDYRQDPKGGLKLEISISKDQCRTWEKISSISDPGRDMDNAQMIELPDGSILLACRTVRWQEYYALPVFKSTNKGESWEKISTIDENQGKPGELGKPDKGIYEPHFYLLDDGRLTVMYANEKHVVENPSYSQIISQRISPDMGRSWGKEIWVVYQPGHGASRPGMSVFTKMKNGKYIVVYEICGPESCNVYSKISEDGINWPVGLGNLIAGQQAAPFILSLNSGALVVTSNNSNVSVSTNYGATWKTVNAAWSKTLWPSIYQTGENEIGIITSVPVMPTGNNIQVRFGQIDQ